MDFTKYLIEKGVWVQGFCWPSYSQMPGKVSDFDLNDERKPITLFVQEQYGRFGNNFIQVIHSLIVARNLSISNIQYNFYLDQNETKTIIVGDITLIFGISHFPEPPYISGTMFYLQGFEKFINSIDCNQIKFDAERIHKALFPVKLYKNRDWTKNKIAFHFRSGDIFEVYASPIYTQPPLSYYVKTYEHISATMKDLDIYLIYENTNNPVIEKFKSFLTDRGVCYHNQSSNINEDAQLIASADCIVASFSSFCDVLALMNSNLRRWYSFRTVSAYEMIDLSICSHFSQILQADGVEVFVIRDNKELYIKLGEWEFSPKHIDQVLNYPAVNLSIERAGRLLPP